MTDVIKEKKSGKREKYKQEIIGIISFYYNGEWEEKKYTNKKQYLTDLQSYYDSYTPGHVKSKPLSLSEDKDFRRAHAYISEKTFNFNKPGFGVILPEDPKECEMVQKLYIDHMEKEKAFFDTYCNI